MVVWAGAWVLWAEALFGLNVARVRARVHTRAGWKGPPGRVLDLHGGELGGGSEGEWWPGLDLHHPTAGWPQANCVTATRPLAHTGDHVR
jgi:hypothetical protein